MYSKVEETDFPFLGITSQMPVRALPGPDQSQECRTPSESPTWIAALETSPVAAFQDTCYQNLGMESGAGTEIQIFR